MQLKSVKLRNQAGLLHQAVAVLENTGPLRFVHDLKLLAEKTNELADAYETLEITVANEKGGGPWVEFDQHFKAMNEARTLMIDSEY